MGLLAACAPHHASSHPVERVPTASGQARALKLWTNGGCYLERRGPNTQRGSGRQEVAALAGHGVIGKQNKNRRNEQRDKNHRAPERFVSYYLHHAIHLRL